MLGEMMLKDLIPQFLKFVLDDPPQNLTGYSKSHLSQVAQKGPCLRQGFGRQADAS